MLVVVTHLATDAALAATVDELARIGRGARRPRCHAGRGRAGPVTGPARTHQWRGVIEEYRDRLPVSDGDTGRDPARGRHAARPAQRASPRSPGARSGSRSRAPNPTGSFKDRGMTMAISKAAEAGAQAVICASTGNTSASAAAYAVRAGMICAVLVPDGKIALGKIAQALVHGAQLLQVDGNFDDCLDRRPQAVRALPGRAGQLGQPVPDRGAEDRRLRDRRPARRRARHPLPPGRQRRQHHRLLEGLPRVRRRRHGVPHARGCGASRRPAPRRSSTARRSRARRPSPPRSASATRRPGSRRCRPGTSPAA